MSCYIHFFVKVGDKFAPISSFSRSTKIYELFENMAPWEKVRPLSEARLREALSDAIERVQELSKKLDEMPARKVLIASSITPLTRRWRRSLTWRGMSATCVRNWMRCGARLNLSAS